VRRLLVIVAAGSGTRLGRDLPKALVPVGGTPILDRALRAFEPLALDDVVVAAPESHRAEFERITAGRARLVAGGATRSGSVRAGFSALGAADDDLVAVHDAARPFVRPDEADAVYAAAAATGAAIAAIPVVDTVKRVADGRIVATVDREGLYGAATPQAFRAAVLRRALDSGRDATDESVLCEDLGIPVAVVPVSRRAFKITTAEDLELAEGMLLRDRESSGGGGRS
jgi:2-C-methyl-D-erythritol 4-phosphate cytidylyltransferase